MPRDSGALNALLLVAVVLCALSVVTSQHKARKLFNELQKEKEHAEQMEVEWGQLQLEQSTLATSARIEKIAAKQLRMQMPKGSQIRIVRIGPLEQPSHPPGARTSTRPQSSPACGESEARGAKPGDRPIPAGDGGLRAFKERTSNHELRGQCTS